MKERVKVDVTKDAYEQIQHVDFSDVVVKLKSLKRELNLDDKTEKDHCAILDIEIPQKENQMNIDKVETQTEHQEEMSALISLNRMNESVEDFLDGLKGENEWNGEGLPPVGVWFEISANMANTVWNKCRVVHYHNNLAWLDFECNEIMNMIKNLNNNVIRPTETPQQREDRERLDCIKKMHRDGNVDGAESDLLFFSIEGILTNLYDAGYRKGVE